GTYTNAYYQAYDNGYGVVYDISAYPDCTLELIDYRHSPWSIFGTWDYKLHVVDWDTYTEVFVTDVLQTTGDDQWEEGISLGSLAGESGLVGIFLEPMSNDPADAYPCLDGDNNLDGMSYYGPLDDYSGMALSGVGDFLMDLWIMTAGDKIVVKPPKVQITAPGNGIGRNGTSSLTGTEFTLKQTENTSSIKSELEGYNVLRDGEEIGYVAVPTTEYDDLDLDPGLYEYCVTAVYDDGESLPVCDTVTVDPTAPPPPPSNLETDVVDEDIVLTWDAPGNVWMQWDDGVNPGNGIGLIGGGTFSVSSHWDPASLEDYNGLTLTKIQFFALGDPDAEYTIKVWTGATGMNEVLSQDVVSFTVDDWNVIDLSTPVPIDGTLDFWFGYEVTHGDGTNPAGCDDGPAIAGYGDMILLSGGSWASLVGINPTLDYNWNLAGYVEALDGTTELLGKVITPTTTNGTLVASGSTGISNKMKTGGKSFEGYNVYYNFNSGGYTFEAFTEETTFTHEGMGIVIGLHCYEVTALYDEQGESDPTDESCELITSVPEFLLNATTVYPNPASDVVNIKSDFEIESIRVYSHSGQIVADQLINNTMYQLNTSEFNSGLYLFRIETSEGTITKRIVIQ
ncbi:MAG: T9SS type A sorting domain-containing protein, partial [Bacteroidetes bacterium]|nr:T9SS type A sorting domain-containing protein [Bacteroidota bacterium]